MSLIAPLPLSTLAPAPPPEPLRLPPDEVLARFGSGRSIDGPATVVVAHPDDETAFFGSGMRRLRELTLVHVTDGAPRDGADARRAGFAGPETYAAARRRELEAALTAMKVRPSHRLAYEVPDQEAVLRLVELSRRLADDLAGMALVVTHAYEGGHPDHDATAFAVQAACDLLAREGVTPPLRLEFAGYHLASGLLRTGAFWPDPNAPQTGLARSGEEHERRRRAFACYVTQADALAMLGAENERVRLAPTYDFGEPPPPGAVLFQRLGLRITGEAWRARARAARRDLGLEVVA